MARQDRERHIRVRERQREDIDLDSLIEALPMIGEDHCRDQEEATRRDETSPGSQPETGR